MCVCVCVTELKGRELLEIVGSPAHMAAYPSFAQIQLNTMAMSLSSADSERSGSLLSLVKKPVTNRLTDITTRALMYGRADASERRRQTQGVRVQNYAEKVEVCIGQIGGASRAAVIKNLVAAAASKARSVAGSAAAAGMASATAPAALAGAIGSGVPAAGAVNAELAAANAAAELEMADDHADDDIDAELGHDLVTAGVAVMSAPEGDVHAELLLSDAGLDVLAGLSWAMRPGVCLQGPLYATVQRRLQQRRLRHSIALSSNSVQSRLHARAHVLARASAFLALASNCEGRGSCVTLCVCVCVCCGCLCCVCVCVCVHGAGVRGVAINEFAGVRALVACATIYASACVLQMYSIRGK